MRRAVAFPLLSLLLFAALATPPARAADPFTHRVTGEELLRTTLARPAAKIAGAKTLHGEFRQSRELREIPKPLIATGEFVFARELGVYWHTRVPFDSVIVLNEAGMLQIDEGAQAVRMSADEQPAVRLIASLFTALFTLDVARLDRDFQLYSAGDAARWTVGLEPRPGTLAGVIRRVTITGSADVEKVELTDAQGERTLIELGAIEYSAEGPADEVRALLDPKRP